MTFNVSLTTTVNPLLMFRMTPNGKYASAFNSQLTANSLQLTADSFYLLTAFLTTVTDSSLPLRMTFYGLLHHDSEPSSSLRVIPDRPPSEEAAGARSAIEDTRLS